MKRLADHRRSNAQLAALFFAPTGFIVALGIVLILSLLNSSALRLDQAQQGAEDRLAQSVVTTLVTALEKSAADYANWDDMYDQFMTQPDAQWARENLGPYAVDAFGLSHILVLAADGSIKYDFTPQPVTDGRPDPAEIAALQGFAQSAMNSWRTGTIMPIGGAVSIHGQPHLVAISPIAVNSEARRALGQAPQNSLIFVQDLDESRLAAIGADFGLMGLRTTFGADGILPLTDPLNTPGIVSLVWLRSQVGSQFVSDAIPSILLVGAAVIVLIAFLGFGWAVIVRSIGQGARAAEQAEPFKESVRRQHDSRASHALERHHRLLGDHVDGDAGTDREPEIQGICGRYRFERTASPRHREQYPAVFQNRGGPHRCGHRAPEIWNRPSPILCAS